MLQRSDEVAHFAQAMTAARRATLCSAPLAVVVVISAVTFTVIWRPHY